MQNECAAFFFKKKIYNRRKYFYNSLLIIKMKYDIWKFNYGKNCSGYQIQSISVNSYVD
jgi:hypothetical protein